MDTGENLELVVETQAEEADRDLDKLIDRLGEVIERLKNVMFLFIDELHAFTHHAGSLVAAAQGHLFP